MLYASVHTGMHEWRWMQLWMFARWMPSKASKHVAIGTSTSKCRTERIVGRQCRTIVSAIIIIYTFGVPSYFLSLLDGPFRYTLRCSSVIYIYFSYNLYVESRVFINSYGYSVALVGQQYQLKSSCCHYQPFSSIYNYHIRFKQKRNYLFISQQMHSIQFVYLVDSLVCMY